MIRWLWGIVADWAVPQGLFIVGPTDEWEDPASWAARRAASPTRRLEGRRMHWLWNYWFNYEWPSLKGNGPEDVTSSLTKLTMAALLVPIVRKWIKHVISETHADLGLIERDAVKDFKLIEKDLAKPFRWLWRKIRRTPPPAAQASGSVKA